MDTELKDISLRKIGPIKSIGVVINDLTETGKKDCTDIVSEIVIDTQLTDALENLADFSHIIILYWMHHDHRPDEKKLLKSRPQRDTNNPRIGIFATRSPDRPNRIGISIAKLVHLKDNILKVTGFDAIDSTPIVDIKPYIPGLDTVSNIKIASWAMKSEQE